MAKKEISIFQIKEFSYGRKFNLLGKLYLSVLSRNLAHLGLERDFSVLVLINEMGDECCQKFIANTLHIDKAMMVGVLDDLGSKGFIKRAQNPSDRREYFVQLTAKGKESIPEILKTVNRLNKSILKNQKQTDIQRLNKQLESIYANLLDSSNSL
jgi:MarR family transcriptional regulator, transcriptional regulator for hemolysin